MENLEHFYFDTDDAFNFYKEVWGGENIHVGFYRPDVPPSTEAVLEASKRSLSYLLDLVAPALTPSGNGSGCRRVMDMGSAYGGCAREMARRFDCEVLCIDLSVRENQINRTRTKAENLDHLVKCPTELSYNDTSAPSDTFDVVVSIDSFMYSGPHVLKEVARVLKPGGTVWFVDALRCENVPDSALVAAQAHVPGIQGMGTPSQFVKAGAEYGLRLTRFEDRTQDMATHYGTVHDTLLSARDAGTLEGKISEGFIKRMLKGLKVWVDHAANGNLLYGCMAFIKPSKQTE